MNDPSASGFRPGPTLRAGAVLAAFLLLFIVIDRFSGPGGDGPPAGTGAAGRATTTSAGGTAPGESTTTKAPPSTAAPTTTAPTTTTRRPGTSRPGTTPTTRLRSARGVDIQVLNGTGELRIAQDFAPLARKEGYDVVRTANANGHYQISTVFYTPGHRADAEAFRARFPAFRIIDQAPSTLSSTVALHVVLGENYRP